MALGTSVPPCNSHLQELVQYCRLLEFPGSSSCYQDEALERPVTINAKGRAFPASQGD